MLLPTNNLLFHSISYNPISDKGLGEMKQGLLKCTELKILGYGFVVLFLCVHLITTSFLQSTWDKFDGKVWCSFK